MSSSGPPSGPPPGRVRRPHRSRSFLQGKLLYGDQLLTLDCTIRDFSPKGARVKLATSAPMPGEVWLLHVRERAAYKAKVVWRRLPEIGLDFEEPVDFDAPDPPSRILRRLLHEAAPREADGLD